MLNRLAIAHYRCLILAFTLIMANHAGVTHADSTPVPTSSDALVLQCDGIDPLCEGDGVMVEFLASGESSRTNGWWSLARVTLQPDAIVQPGGGDLPTHYTVYVEEGAVGLTASVPVTCVGECRVEVQAPAATPDAHSTSGMLVPAGIEVILAPGDVATFEGTNESEHVYRNAEDLEARFVSTMFASTPDDLRCRGRCLDSF